MKKTYTVKKGRVLVKQQVRVVDHAVEHGDVHITITGNNKTEAVVPAEHLSDLKEALTELYFSFVNDESI